MSSRGVLSLDQEVGVSDIVLLEPLTEEAFIANLYQRFKRDQIYTYIGNVVISVNPYKKLALYSGDVIQAYQSRSMFDLPPHIYAIADVAYRSMRDKNQDQCMIISGESGSGKTEASKLVMHYVAAVSGKGREVDCIKEQLLQSNPLLEAFGNGKTHCNDNSSRFGKYMDIEFDFKGDPIGGIITNYLLEKSRVTNQALGERNFHIFYQLLVGADIQLLKSLKLQRNIDNYVILRNRTSSSPQDINEDKVNFAITKRAMEVVGLSSEEIHSVFQMVSGVLKLGNIEFIPHANMDGTEGCIITNDYEIYDICEIFGCDITSLQSALTQRVIEARHEMIITDLTSVEASYGRDSLCKALYSRLFTWIVNRINDGIKVKKYGKRKALGVLDIYGFEVFENNSFEQLIINYCNEKLQQIFIELTLQEEQEEYIREGIQWAHVDYFNNAVICDLIEKNNHGILATLDEECLRPGHVSDETFLHKLDQMCAGHPHYESRTCRNPNTSADAPVLNSDCFRIRHYAGTVTYSVRGFIDKNSDLLYRDLSHVMYMCDSSLLKVLFPEGNPKRTTLKRPTTTGTQFKISIGALMKNLQAKCPNYIRCIKPNELKQPRIFEMALVQHQVRYLGLVENVRVRRAGYAYRQTYDQFLTRYKVLSLHTWPSWRGLAAEGVTYLLRDLPIPPSEYAFGRTKLFIKNPRTLVEIEDYRRLRLDELATLIQKTYRGWKQRKAFLLAKNSQTLIAAQWRRWKARNDFLRIREAARTLQRFWRKFGFKLVSTRRRSSRIRRTSYYYRSRSQTPSRVQNPSQAQTNEQNRSHTPSRNEDHSSNSSREQIHSNASSREQIRSHTPSRDEIRSHASSREQIRSSTSNREQIRSHTPNRDQIRSHTPSRDQIRSHTPSRDQTRSHTPNRDQIRRRTPNRDQIREDSPCEDQIHSHVPFQDQMFYRRQNQDGLSHTPSREQLRSESHTPSGEPNGSQTPNKMQNWSRTPGRTQHRSKTPTKGQHGSQTPRRVASPKFDEAPDPDEELRQAREELLQLRHKKKMHWAAGIIQYSYKKWKKRKFLLYMAQNLPSNSPISHEWPTAPPDLVDISQAIRKLFHKWRCHKYRLKLDQTARNRMREKVTASIIFRDKKASYPRSISHPFQGDYVRLRKNAQWRKVCSETNDQYVVFADIINKVTRSGGKCVPILFVVSTCAMLVMDQRTMQIKYRVPASNIFRLSLSPFFDDIAVFHVRPTEMTKKKGDFVFQTGHVIEIITKVFLVVQNATGKPPEVNIASEFEANFGNHTVTFSFKSSGLPEFQPGQMKIARKANRMEVVL